MSKSKRVKIGQGAESFYTAEPEKPENQDTSTPVEETETKEGEEKYVKATYYITPEQDLKLEQIRLARKRKRRGVRIDKSSLIREAIDLLQE